MKQRIEYLFGGELARLMYFDDDSPEKRNSYCVYVRVYKSEHLRVVEHNSQGWNYPERIVGGYVGIQIKVK